MMKTKWKYLIPMLCAGWLTAWAACSSNQHDGGNHDVNFVGYVYNGITHEPITTYKLTVRYNDKTKTARVESDGRYRIGPIPAWTDFTVTIEVEGGGFRAFRSHNGGFDLPEGLTAVDGAANIDTEQTFFFDAFLYPDTAQSPATRIFVQATEAKGTVKGKLRLVPTSSAAGGTLSSDEVPGVGEPASGGNPSTAQIWGNDADLQNSVLIQEFSGTEIEIAAGKLLWGVPYEGTLFEVTDDEKSYQPAMENFTAGSQTAIEIPVSQVTEPIKLTNNDAANCVLTTSATQPTAAIAKITLTFDDDISIDLAGNISTFEFREEFDDALVVTGGTVTPPVSDSTSFPERGASYSVIDNKLTLQWDTSNWGWTAAPTCVQYHLLDQLLISRMGSPGSVRNLAALLTKNSLSCGSACP